MPATPFNPRARTGARSWLIAAIAVGLLTGGIALAGGFEPAAPRPADTAVGEQINLTRWDVTVDGCQITPADQYRDQPLVQINLTVTNTWDASQASLNRAAVSIRMPNGERFGSSDEWFRMYDAERSGGFDPGFERPAVITMDLAEPLWTDGAPVRLLLATERQRDGFILSGNWVADETAAVLDLDCPVVTP